MKPPISLFRSQLDGFENQPFLHRIIQSIGNKEQPSDMVACFAPVNAPRTAIINRCKDVAAKSSLSGQTRRLHFIPPFCTSTFISIGNLSVAILWHLYKSLPDHVKSDEKVIYRLGKISVSLPALSDVFSPALTRIKSDSEQNPSHSNTIFSPEIKSSVSSTFSVCEQVQDLSNSFKELGNLIALLGGFDSVVISVLDADLCLPHQSTSLLYTLKNIFSCEQISCILITDKSLLRNILAATHNGALEKNDADKIIYSFFDDWVTVPALSLRQTLQHTRNILSTEEREEVIKQVSESGMLTLLPDEYTLDQCMNRYCRYINLNSETLKKHEHGTVAMLFLLSTIAREKLSILAQLPDLADFIRKVRTVVTSRNSAQESSRIPETPLTLLPGIKKEKAGAFPLTYFELLYKDEKSVSLFFSHVPQHISDQRLADTITSVIPFF